MTELEKNLFAYFFIGMLLYPVSMDMWYRQCHKKSEFYAPGNLNWYGGFFVFVTTWPLGILVNIIYYLREMSK